jgi:hypothetical protein
MAQNNHVKVDDPRLLMKDLERMKRNATKVFGQLHGDMLGNGATKEDHIQGLHLGREVMNKCDELRKLLEDLEDFQTMSNRKNRH